MARGVYVRPASPKRMGPQDNQPKGVSSPRLTSRNRRYDQEEPAEPVEPRPPGAAAGQSGTAGY
jgi:hypothetical protein